MTKAIDISHLSKRFSTKRGSTLVLDDISLSIAPGEFLTIVGASGCGKSTLLRIIAGLETSDSGSVHVGSKAVCGPGVDRAMVFQDYSLFPWMTVKRNVLFSRRLAANNHDKLARQRGAEHERALRLISLVGLSAVQDSYPSQLSGGMRQRVAIARALMSKPSIILMDEPFGALDAQTREVMQDLVLSVVAQEGTTIVFVTHDVEEALYLGSRVVLMSPHPGRIDTIYDVPMDRDRNVMMRVDPRFVALKRMVMDRVRETVGLSLDKSAMENNLVEA
ncbi:ABC transporter ATP-binding protein [Hyphomicrobium sp.]|jgi:NitT/TauT family transport system ATP-binding protein|uniref:ABC transporter ATP-binding protein n=1 Tax=Hyphomicrobium sp. TaxID=82 RepID=UPI002CC03CF0|nr:ABC transporter ATP-binding protein [Hyphomicrobium sp.]HVZ04086.1 ABC transporter ATP-binding protein [Hyphomicrobium sp.]